MIGPPEDPDDADDEELVPATVTLMDPGGDDLEAADLGGGLAGNSRPPPVAAVWAHRVLATISPWSRNVREKSETESLNNFYPKT